MSHTKASAADEGEGHGGEPAQHHVGTTAQH